MNLKFENKLKVSSNPPQTVTYQLVDIRLQGDTRCIGSTNKKSHDIPKNTDVVQDE